MSRIPKRLCLGIFDIGHKNRFHNVIVDANSNNKTPYSVYMRVFFVIFISADIKRNAVIRRLDTYKYTETYLSSKNIDDIYENRCFSSGIWCP